MVSQHLLDELKTILKEDYGLELQQQAVAGIGNTLVSFFELLAKIDYEREDSNE